MRILVLLPLLIVLGMSSSVAQDAKPELRTWTAVNGKEVEAEFVSNSDGQVSLKMKSGKIFKVPLNKLSKADQEFLKAKSSPKEPTKEAPVSPESRIIGYWTLDSEKSLKALESLPESPDRDEVEEFREDVSEAAKENVLILNFSKGGKVEIYQGDDADPDSSAYTFFSEDAEAISVKIEDVGSFVLKGDTLQMIPPEGESGIMGCYILSRIDQFRVIKRGNLKYQIVGGAITVTECDVNASGALTIPASIEGNPVTSIGRAAFEGCRSLTSISIPDGVTSIGEYAFEKCTSLTSITIGNGVTSIGEFAFRFCTDLTSIEVGAGNVNYTGVNGVLFNAEKTMLLTYPKGKTDANYTIPNSVTNIGERAFFHCERLTSITIPDSVISIGEKSFEKCSGLTSITIPDGVTSIGRDVFYGCRGLTSITIPDGVTSIGERAFNDCTSLTSISIPDGVTSIEGGAFGSCSSLTSITIPDGVTSIGGSAFRDCRGLTSITIPESVTSIGRDAFYGCSGLTSITIPDGVTSIGDWAFRECTNLTSISIPDSVTSIGGYAFYNCYNLTSITIPESVTSIGDEAFRGCTGLTSINIPDGVTSIGRDVFYGCRGLTSITIPDGVTSIGRDAFYGCGSLTSITIPDGVTSIGEWAFYGCGSLTSITIPDGVTSIGEYAFKNCSNLENLTIGNGVTSIGKQAFWKCSSLTSITIPDSVTSIGDSAFRSCSSLTSITIPNGVTGIRYGAFSGCTSLTSITIPDGVTSIGRYAFTGCTSLIEVTFLGDAPKLNEPSFGPGPTIYRKPDAKGWTDTFGRRLVPVKLISEKPPSPDAKIAQAGKIDLDDPETRKKITARAIVWRMLQRRGRNGKKLLYAPNQKKPYTGWGKAFHDNGQIRNLAQYKDGKKSGSARWWYRNEQKGSATTWMNGKVLTVSGWKPNGEKCPVTNVLNGNGVHVLYKEDGTEKERKTYREGLPVDSRAKAGG